ncbi:MAG: hypothetical protein Tsb0010_00920 [Parvularculaceae bacterium]
MSGVGAPAEGVGNDLIFDVGMNTGVDTAYYLHKGYRVVAIEAIPQLCRQAEEKFAAEIAAGRLVIENCGVAAAPGEAEFWVSDKNIEWSSFDKANAAKDDGSAHSIAVKCRPFSDLLDAHGVPIYLKIDIEGNDWLCLQALGPERRPRYISIEMSHTDGFRHIDMLAAIGYRRFKCIRQNDFRPMTPGNVGLYGAARRLAATSCKLNQLYKKHKSRRVMDGDWTFAFGSSGPFGEATPGPWLTRAQLEAVWESLRKTDTVTTGKGVGEWFDFHAAV